MKDVGPRSGRRKRAEERYALALFLRARSDYAFIKFPIEVVELTGHKQPDFTVAEAGTAPVTLEVTRATTPKLQRQMTEAEREAGVQSQASVKHPTRSEPVSISLRLNGTAANDHQRRWLGLIEESVRRKLGKLDSYSKATGLTRHDLLIYDDTPILGVARSRVLPLLARRIHDNRKRSASLGKVSIIMSLDVVYDIDGQCRTLPFLEMQAPDQFSDFGERIEYAAQRAVRDELEKTGLR